MTALTDGEPTAIRRQQRLTADERARGPYVRANGPELRSQSATMWVDMEEGIFPKPEDEKHTAWPSKNVIAQRLGFAGTGKTTPSFLRDPEFSRAVEYERIRRVASGTGKLSVEEFEVLASLVSRSLLLEAARRTTLEPQKIATRELLVEARNYSAAALARQNAAGGPSPVVQHITVFMKATDRLPPKAREKARAIFEQEMSKLALEAGEAFAQGSKG